MAVTSIVFTQKGEEFTVDAWDGTTALTPNKLGIGTGSTAANKADTTLVTEVETRGTCTLTQVGTNGDVLQAVGQVAITASRALREFGLFDAASAGNLIVRGVHDVINLDNGDAIEWTIQISPT